MSTWISNPKIVNVFRFLPEIWYLILFAFYLWDQICYITVNENWDRLFSISYLLVVICIGLLIKQISHKNGWISLMLGIIFTFASFWMIGASISEYKEFPTEGEFEATSFIILWTTVFGTSLILAIRMFYLGQHRIYSS